MQLYFLDHSSNGCDSGSTCYWSSRGESDHLDCPRTVSGLDDDMEEQTLENESTNGASNTSLGDKKIDIDVRASPDWTFMPYKDAVVEMFCGRGQGDLLMAA